MKAVLINDTSDNRHFGCELVGAAYRRLLAERDVELLGVQYRKQVLDRRLCDKADIVIVNGEGCIHDGGYSELLEIGAIYPAVLINCSIQNMDTLNLTEFKIVTVRESLSAEYTSTEIVPDLIFSTKIKWKEATHELFTCDSSARTNKEGTIRVTTPGFVDKLLSAQKACLGRFHAIALAAMGEIPFSAFPANTWKIEGLMKDMGASEHYYSTPYEALRNVPEEITESIQTYADEAPKKINALFDRIAEL